MSDREWPDWVFESTRQEEETDEAMMKNRFLVFAYDRNEPAGPLQMLKSAHETTEQAQAAAEELKKEYSGVEVLDVTTLKRVVLT